MTRATPLLVGLRLVVLALGIAITVISFRAYRRERTPYLRDASIGFGIITVGVFIEGVLYQLLNLDLTTAHEIESLAIAIGFLVLLRSFLR